MTGAWLDRPPLGPSNPAGLEFRVGDCRAPAECRQWSCVTVICGRSRAVLGSGSEGEPWPHGRRLVEGPSRRDDEDRSLLRGPRSWPPPGVDRLTSEIADLTRVDFEGGRHMLNMEQPERFTEEVIELLAERCTSPPASPRPHTRTSRHAQGPVGSLRPRPLSSSSASPSGRREAPGR